ncbi:hypothetical protein D3C75_1241940 [compost metagenome]
MEVRIPQRRILMADFVLVEVVIRPTFYLGQESAWTNGADLNLAMIDQVLNFTHSRLLP